jgi:hypothetical protein
MNCTNTVHPIQRICSYISLELLHINYSLNYYNLIYIYIHIQYTLYTHYTLYSIHTHTQLYAFIINNHQIILCSV